MMHRPSSPLQSSREQSSSTTPPAVNGKRQREDRKERECAVKTTTYHQDAAAPRNDKLLAFLVRSCPTDPLKYTTEEEARVWAANLLRALQEKHGTDDDAIRAHARSLSFNLRRNGRTLSRFSPDDLAKLSPEDLAEGTTASTKRQKASLDGWDPPPPPEPLPNDSGWLAAAMSSGKRLVLVLCEDHIYQAYQRYFGSVPHVDVIQHDDITTLPGPCDAFISPANTRGNMDGGVDRAYADYFGWSYGRPYSSPNLLQLAMDEAAGELNAEFPVGHAILVRDSAHPTALIAAPTMALPGKIKTNSRIVYQAARAALQIFRETSDLRVIRMPAFGTGWGEVPAEIAAAQTWEAFVAVWE